MRNVLVTNVTMMGNVNNQMIYNIKSTCCNAWDQYQHKTDDNLYICCECSEEFEELEA